jgi:hypothetical protein
MFHASLLYNLQPDVEVLEDSVEPESTAPQPELLKALARIKQNKSRRYPCPIRPCGMAPMRQRALMV